MAQNNRVQDDNMLDLAFEEQYIYIDNTKIYYADKVLSITVYNNWNANIGYIGNNVRKKTIDFSEYAGAVKVCIKGINEESYFGLTRRW